jgi:hypothetical protein
MGKEGRKRNCRGQVQSQGGHLTSLHRPLLLWSWPGKRGQAHAGAHTHTCEDTHVLHRRLHGGQEAEGIPSQAKPQPQKPQEVKGHLDLLALGPSPQPGLPNS